MSNKKYGREQNKIIICLFNYWYSDCFWDGEKQQQQWQIMPPTTRHFSNSKQNCSQRHRSVTVIIFPLHWGIFCHFFFTDIITDNDWTELVAVIRTYIYIHIYVIYIQTCTYIHIMQNLTWWPKECWIQIIHCYRYFITNAETSPWRTPQVTTRTTNTELQPAIIGQSQYLSLCFCDYHGQFLLQI